MTVIVAIPTEHGVFVGADSQVTRNSSIVGHVDKIVVKQCGDHQVLIATTGNQRLFSLAQHALALPDAPDPCDAADCDGWAYAVACALAELAVDARPPVLDDGQVDGEALLAFDRHLWLLNGQCAMRIDGAFAIGSGAPEARGALHALRYVASNVDPAWSIGTAIHAAIDLDPNCGGKIVITRTDAIKP